jgi:succinate dehydrogenase/fumarate reductase flavoprotein subunit
MKKINCDVVVVSAGLEGSMAARTIVDKKYNYKKTIKDVYKHHQIVKINPGLFAVDLF